MTHQHPDPDDDRRIVRGISLPTSLWARLDRAAERRKKSRSRLAAKWLRERLEAEEAKDPPA